MPMCPKCEKLVKGEWEKRTLVLHRTCLMAFVHERESRVIENYSHLVQCMLDRRDFEKDKHDT